ncbi:hypothetical protein IMZ11_01575 [Microtetraspora sp. AC03309]|uniref:hypothetical protein n=1 Tax=Microtetraspora sp. AC03309 TaxID=2779376 RepID=UPI001E494C5D|nr:hypothetical protein [Microtetraspora sp. AC03309]MCC5574331.1 hypothetical protein [Microtetraspora sp. AC03309]
MSLFRALTKPLRSLFKRGDELKDKAKDLPVNALQTTLSGVGQALLIGDQVRSTIKRITTPESEEAPAPAPTVAEPAAEEERPARRQPVIFAPRPSAKEEHEPNGSKAAEEPVILSPDKKAEWEAPAVEKPVEKPAPSAAEQPEPQVAAPEKPAAEKPAAEKPAPKKPAAQEEVKPEAEKAAVEQPAAKPEAEKPAPAKPAAQKPAPKKPAAEKPAAEKPKTAKPRTKKAAEAAAEAEPTVAPKARAKKKAAPEVEEAALAEPYPGYAGLTLASLRARMRGKSADQIRDLIAYEKATEDREDVVRMYETRLAKIEAES